MCKGYTYMYIHAAIHFIFRVGMCRIIKGDRNWAKHNVKLEGLRGLWGMCFGWARRRQRNKRGEGVKSISLLWKELCASASKFRAFGPRGGDSSLSNRETPAGAVLDSRCDYDIFLLEIKNFFFLNIFTIFP